MSITPWSWTQQNTSTMLTDGKYYDPDAEVWDKTLEDRTWREEGYGYYQNNPFVQLDSKYGAYLSTIKNKQSLKANAFLYRETGRTNGSRGYFQGYGLPTGSNAHLNIGPPYGTYYRAYLTGATIAKDNMLRNHPLFGATAEELQSAYNALHRGGIIKDFNYKVWNDFVAKVADFQEQWNEYFPADPDTPMPDMSEHGTDHTSMWFARYSNNTVLSENSLVHYRTVEGGSWKVKQNIYIGSRRYSCLVAPPASNYKEWYLLPVYKYNATEKKFEDSGESMYYRYIGSQVNLYQYLLLKHLLEKLAPVGFEWQFDIDKKTGFAIPDAFKSDKLVEPIDDFSDFYKRVFTITDFNPDDESLLYNSWRIPLKAQYLVDLFNVFNYVCNLTPLFTSVADVTINDLSWTLNPRLSDSLLTSTNITMLDNEYIKVDGIYLPNSIAAKLTMDIPFEIGDIDIANYNEVSLGSILNIYNSTMQVTPEVYITVPTTFSALSNNMRMSVSMTYGAEIGFEVTLPFEYTDSINMWLPDWTACSVTDNIAFNLTGEVLNYTAVEVNSPANIIKTEIGIKFNNSDSIANENIVFAEDTNVDAILNTPDSYGVDKFNIAFSHGMSADGEMDDSEQMSGSFTETPTISVNAREGLPYLLSVALQVGDMSLKAFAEYAADLGFIVEFNFTDDLNINTLYELIDSIQTNINSNIEYNINIQLDNYSADSVITEVDFNESHSISANAGEATSTSLSGVSKFILDSFAMVGSKDLSFLDAVLALRQQTDVATLTNANMAGMSADNSLTKFSGEFVDTSLDPTIHAEGAASALLATVSEMLAKTGISMNANLEQALVTLADFGTGLFSFTYADAVYHLYVTGELSASDNAELQANAILLYTALSDLSKSPVFEISEGIFDGRFVAVAETLAEAGVELNANTLFDIQSIIELAKTENIKSMSSEVFSTLVITAAVSSMLNANLSSEVILHDVMSVSKLIVKHTTALDSSVYCILRSVADIGGQTSVWFDSNVTMTLRNNIVNLLSKHAQSSLTSVVKIYLDTISNITVKHATTLNSAVTTAFNIISSLSANKFVAIQAIYKNYLSCESELSVSHYIIITGNMIDSLVTEALFDYNTPIGFVSDASVSNILSEALLELQDLMPMEVSSVISSILADVNLSKDPSANFNAQADLILIPSALMEIERTVSWVKPRWETVDGVLGLNMYQFHTVIRQRDYTDKLRIDSLWYAYSESKTKIKLHRDNEAVALPGAFADSNTVINVNTTGSLYLPSIPWKYPMPVEGYPTIYTMYQFWKTTQIDNDLFIDVTPQTVEGGVTITHDFTGNVDVPIERSVMSIAYSASAELEAEYQTHTLSSISIVTMPDVVKYKPGQVFDTTGIVVELTFSDGVTQQTTGVVADTTPIVKDQTSVSVSVTYKEDTVSVDVPITVIVFNWEVVDVGVTYPFKYLGDETGYWESTNQGQHSTYSYCKVNIQAAKDSVVRIEFIQYAESNYDYAGISNLDTTLAQSTSITSSQCMWYGYGSQSASARYVDFTYPDDEAHFITICYRKDGSANAGNDSIKFKMYLKEE